jgi:hypothetical protein
VIVSESKIRGPVRLLITALQYFEDELASIIAILSSNDFQPLECRSFERLEPEQIEDLA